jgi:predicted permease
MGETLVKLLPVVLGFVAGYLLRRSGVADHGDGDFLFKLMFYICVPAIMFTSLSSVTLSAALAVFPLAAVAAVSTGFLVGRLVAWRVNWPPIQIAVLMCSCMVVNTGFELPFIQALYGAEGIARIAAFDAVNTTLTFTVVYYIAARGNPQHNGGSILLNRLARSPALYAIIAGLLVNLFGVRVPTGITSALSVFGSASAVIITLGVGILFEPLRRGSGKAILAAGLRLATGFLIALVFVLAFDLQGIDRAVILLLGVAPVGFVAVTFASLENLDTKLAVNTLSVSLVVSLVLSLGVTLLS